MISWLLTNWLTQTLWVLAALWFVNGLRKAILKPRVTYVTHSKVEGHGSLLTVRRQQLLPPWLTVEETWLVGAHGNWATRESDGRRLSSACSEDDGHGLLTKLEGLLTVQAARAKETETLST
jgi:hypothetical protein